MRKTAQKIIEETREKRKEIFNEPIPRRDFDDDEIIAGRDDQRMIYRSEKESIHDLFDKRKKRKKSAVWKNKK